MKTEVLKLESITNIEQLQNIGVNTTSFIEQDETYLINICNTIIRLISGNATSSDLYDLYEFTVNGENSYFGYLYKCLYRYYYLKR